MNTFLDKLQLYAVTSDWEPTSKQYSATRRRSCSLGFTNTGVPRQEISGKMDWQKKPWKPRSPNITSLDLFMWGYVNSTVYQSPVTGID